MKIQHFYDKATFTLTYLVYDEVSRDAILIDPVLDYDPNSGTYKFESMNQYVEFANKEKLNVHFVIETHAHADHLTSSHFLKEKWPNAKVAINKNITKVQSVFGDLFNLVDLTSDGSQFDVLFDDEQILEAGTLKIKTLFTPGHTPACATLQIEDALFTGDALFMPDYGTGRCDFPEGSAEDLYESITNKIYSLPDETRVFVGHDYRPNGRELKFETTVGESKANNIRLTGETTRDQFVTFRKERDATLNAPRLLLPSIQVNIRAGEFPKGESNGLSYLKLPLRESK